MQNAQAGFLVKKTTTTETLVSSQSNAIIKSEQKIWHKRSQLEQVFRHPKIQFFSQSNGYKALMCGLIGLVIFPVGIKAISYAKTGLHGDKKEVMMASAGKVLGVISYCLVIGAVIGLLGWFAYKNPSSGQFIGQIIGDFLGDLLEGLADNSN